MFCLSCRSRSLCVELAHGVAHLLEAERPERHGTHHENDRGHGEEDDLPPEAPAGMLDVVLDLVAQAVHAVQHREAKQEGVVDLHPATAEAGRHIVVVDDGDVDLDVVEPDVPEHEEHEDEAGHPHEDPPRELGIRVVGDLGLLEGLRFDRHQKSATISGTILTAANSQKPTESARTAYHMGAWYFTPHSVKSMRMILRPLNAW